MEMMITKKREHEFFRNFLPLVLGTRRKTTAILTLGALSLASSSPVWAQTFTSLHSFNGTDGANPGAVALIQGTSGNLYGTAFGGGANNLGTVFKITPSGTLTRLHSFDGTDGNGPESGPVQAADGNFYGTTRNGGANDSCDVRGCGTVYKITPSGVLTTLYSFCSQSGCTDGDVPYAALLQAADGNLYGGTTAGGAYGYGTIFKITPSGRLTTLHSFDSSDGASPDGELVQGTDGNFYGTAGAGGNGYGTVFKMTPSGMLTTLHIFAGYPTDGDEPLGGLVPAADGSFYGTTYFGGTSNTCSYGSHVGCGTIFKITQSGTLTTLHSFDTTDGSGPKSALVQATDGNLYGTTVYGGADCVPAGCGTVFRVTPSGTLTTLYSFCSQSGCTDGSFATSMLQDTNGRFYGTTNQGGASGDGTVFSFSVGLGPFVETQPTSGKVGAAVKILGTNLTGATSVAFNGTPATFTPSSSLITTTVPAGATTGTVQVVTPHGTLSSNVPFRVRP
jgi:uncharacterized repeat protein (TIGR03803 family)